MSSHFELIMGLEPFLVSSMSNEKSILILSMSSIARLSKPPKQYMKIPSEVLNVQLEAFSLAIFKDGKG